MDNFDLKPEPKKFNFISLVWNILTVGVLLGICCVAFFILIIFNNPNSPLNPFPPAVLPTLYKTVTPTSTLVMILREATWTPTVTIQPSPTRTKAPTWTTAPTWTFLSQIVTRSVTPTPSVTTIGPKTTISPTPMPATTDITYLPYKNCNWLGVAGKVLGTDGKPIQFMEILLGGTLDGKAISYLILSGNAPAYGPSGFEQALSNHPIASTHTLWIQLLDNTAKPLTNKINFDTYSTCTQNLVMVVFTRIR
jgi:hypothetical protein